MLLDLYFHQAVGAKRGKANLSSLFRPVQAVATPQVCGKATTRFAVKFPHAVEKISVAASGDYVTGKLVSKYSVLEPYFGVITERCVGKNSTRWVVETATTGSASPFVRGRAYATNDVRTPVGAAFAPAVRSRNWTTGWAVPPDTVQNPSEEMLLALW